jgi:hypothetical protein
MGDGFWKNRDSASAPLSIFRERVIVGNGSVSSLDRQGKDIGVSVVRFINCKI